ncbi:hypothetical protein LOD99_14071 [Oopsacas minuta]|uniref:Uncharacterized protein n=1 Tax=Oopsacas minuta TaxID=111878 RepID=A0AAV7KGQ6_9METZ|nr:hypothetical protein LOD99_14071 [Oopsacas minuta]
MEPCFISVFLDFSSGLTSRYSISYLLKSYRLKLKARVSIIVTELVISIVIPILFVIGSLALRDGRPYMSIYIWLIVSDSDNIDESLPSLILYFIPLFASSLGILTLTPLIVSRI